MIKSVNTRAVVLDILLEVNENDGYSHITVNNALKKYQYLDKKERAFISRLSQGTIERQITIDYVIDEFSQVAVKRMKPVIRNILRMSVYQIMYMDTVPDSAAVDEAVKLANRRGFFNLSSFVNGVLRNVVRSHDLVSFPDREKNLLRHLSIKYSMPEWIIRKWLSEFDEETVEKMLRSFLTVDDTTIRCNTNRISVEELKKSLEEENVVATEAPYLPFALKISGYNYLDTVKSFKDGLFQIQDISSMLVGLVAHPKKDSYVIDVCAAPGGKSLHVSELLGATGYVEARDLTESKVNLIKENIERMQAVNVGARVMDALTLDELSIEKADIVIADLPCSGIGVIGKKKDIKYKMTKEKQEELEKLQRDILSQVQNYVKPGGFLIYSTCTVNSGENIENVRWFMKNFKFELEGFSELLPKELVCKTTDKGYLQLIPGVHKCDGFFIAKLKRIG